jgi:hypothetical protein
MGVHVPEAGDEELASSVDSLGAAGNRDCADGSDAIAFGDHRDVLLKTAGGHVDHGDVRDGNGPEGGEGGRERQ